MQLRGIRSRAHGRPRHPPHQNNLTNFVRRLSEVFRHPYSYGYP